MIIGPPASAVNNRKDPWMQRREFLQYSALVAGFSIVPRCAVAGSLQKAPSDKLNIGFVGVGGRGKASLNALRDENNVAMCDVDAQRAADSLAAYPGTRQYRDFRKLLDAHDKELDAVVVATPDHTHAIIANTAMQRGKHVYCEKPLAHSIDEIRQLRRTAAEHQVVTQLGNQGHSYDHIRLFCEMIWDGAIGNVHTVHASHGSRGSSYSRIAQLPQLAEKYAVPETLQWDLWLGPAADRPYNPVYLPGSWRGWLDFGTGCVGDWICHVVDPVFWALDLGAPTSVMAHVVDYQPQQHAQVYPPGTKIEYQFAGNDERGPVKLVWYDGACSAPVPDDLDMKMPIPGAIVLGDKGGIKYGSHGANGVSLFPKAKMAAYQRPAPTLPRVTSHHRDWTDAIRNGRQAGSNFDYGGPLTELALLGVIAIRYPETKLLWDSTGARFTNHAAANQWIAPAPREGWALS
jgi:predicted dehydrogenase